MCCFDISCKKCYATDVWRGQNEVRWEDAPRERQQAASSPSSLLQLQGKSEEVRFVASIPGASRTNGTSTKLLLGSRFRRFVGFGLWVLGGALKSGARRHRVFHLVASASSLRTSARRTAEAGLLVTWFIANDRLSGRELNTL